jgi:hypothetical protein
MQIPISLVRCEMAKDSSPTMPTRKKKRDKAGKADGRRCIKSRGAQEFDSEGNAAKRGRTGLQLFV